MPQIQTASDIIAFFKDYDLSFSTQNYLKFHALRYLILWQKVTVILDDMLENTLEAVQNEPSSNQKLQILDIGPGLFTELLGQFYPDLEIHTLGLNAAYFDLKTKLIFHKYDLNQLYLEPDSSVALTQNLPKFDLILYCEVLEHLYTGPQASFDFLYQHLKSYGSLLIQTPNAVSLHHRLFMLTGKNPFPLLRPDPNEPGHYREYTQNELVKMLKNSDFEIGQIEFHDYFNYAGNWKNRIYKFCNKFWPTTFRDGITVVVNKNRTRL